MKAASRSLRASALRVGVMLLVAYVGAVALLAFRETDLVFPGAGTEPRWGDVPPAGAEVPWDSLRVPAADGVPVFVIASRLPNWTERPWAIYFHGNGTRIGEPGSLGRFALLRSAGFNVLGVEFRGYGAAASAGRPSEAGIYADAGGAWDYLTRDLGVAPERIVAYGWSLGSGPATWLAAEQPLAGLITEAAYTSLPEVAADLYPWLPVRLVMRNRFDSLRRAPLVDAPWLLLHGREDDFVPSAHAGTLAAAAPDARVVLLDAGHDDGVTADPDVALAALREFGARIGTPQARTE